MATLQWVIVCERAILEENAGTVSLISILENINLPPPPPELMRSGENPGVPLRFYVVQQWARSKPRSGERMSGRLRLIGPKGEFGSQDFVVDLTGMQRARIIAQSLGFPLQGPGLYRCVVEAKLRTKWKQIGETAFSVSYTTASSKTRH